MGIIRDSLTRLAYHLATELGEVPNKTIKENRFIRWGANNKFWLKKKDNYATFGDFETGIKHIIIDSATPKYTRTQYIQQQKQHQEEIRENAQRLKRMWIYMDNKSIDCGYFKRKGISMPGNGLINIKYAEERNHIAYYHYDYGLCAIQHISSSGFKWFEKGSNLKGAFTCITDGRIMQKKYLIMVEGVATGISVYNMMMEIDKDIAVVIVGSMTNYPYVYEQLKSRFKGKIIVVGDYGTTNKIIGDNLPWIVYNPDDFNSNKKGFDANDAYVADRDKAINFLKCSYKLVCNNDG